MKRQSQPLPGAPDRTSALVSAIFFEATQARLKAAAELAELRTRAADLEKQLKAVKESRSWRITRPLRRIGAWIERHRPVDSSRSRLSAGSGSWGEDPGDGSEIGQAEDVGRAGLYNAVTPYVSGGKAAWDACGRARLLEFLRNDERIAFPKSSHPRLSIVLVLHNKAHLSLLTFLSIRDNADVDYEVVIVDNNSQDFTPRLLDRLDNATVIKNVDNAGFGPACMQAVEACTGDFLCFLNNDAQLQAGALGRALKVFEEDRGVGAVGGKILLADGRLQEAGSILWCDATSDGYGRGDDPDLAKYQFRRPVDYCSGAFLFTPRGLFREAGGFDQQFAPAYFEDADYCMSLWQRGLRTLYEPAAMVRHYENASSGQGPHLLRQIATNHYKFYQKWKHVLAKHYEPRGPNTHAARIAVSDTGLNILCIGDGISGQNEQAAAANLRAVEQLAQEKHHVTLASSAGVRSGQPKLPAEVEVFDPASAAADEFDRYVANSDVIWLDHADHLEDIIARLLRLQLEKQVEVIVCETLSNAKPMTVADSPDGLDLEHLGFQVTEITTILASEFGPSDALAFDEADRTVARVWMIAVADETALR